MTFMYIFFYFGGILCLERNTAKPRYLKVCWTGKKTTERYSIIRDIKGKLLKI